MRLCGSSFGMARRGLSARTVRRLAGAAAFAASGGVPAVSADELKDIRGPVPIPGDVLWLWGLLAAAAAVAAVFLFLRRHRRRDVVRAPVPQRPPWEIALEALAALEKEGRATDEQAKWFYSRLSEIIRVYIEQRFEIRAPEMTTEEFLESASASILLEDRQKGSLRDLLNASDLVKFARSVPSGEDMEGALHLARRFIEETRAPSAEAAQPVASAPVGP